MSDPQRPHGLQPTRLLRPWDFPGKSAGVGCHCLLQGKSEEGAFLVFLGLVPLIKPALQQTLKKYIPVGEGNGTPLQYSCLENPVDGGAW